MYCREDTELRLGILPTPYELRGHTANYCVRHHIFCNHTAGCYHATRMDMNAIQNDTACADPAIIL